MSVCRLHHRMLSTLQLPWNLQHLAKCAICPSMHYYANTHSRPTCAVLRPPSLFRGKSPLRRSSEVDAASLLRRSSPHDVMSTCHTSCFPGVVMDPPVHDLLRPSKGSRFFHAFYLPCYHSLVVGCQRAVAATYRPRVLNACLQGQNTPACSHARWGRKADFAGLSFHLRNETLWFRALITPHMRAAGARAR